MLTSLSTDVLVCGGGMAGIVAGVAAARAGAKVLLVERFGFLGGSATAAAVGQFVGWKTEAGRQVIDGIAEEIVRRLIDRHGSNGHADFVMSTGHPMDRVEYDPEVLKVVLDELADEAGVTLLFNSLLLNVEVCDGFIKKAMVLTKGGIIEIQPRAVVDASGDLDATARAGGQFLPLYEGETLQPGTMMFRFGPIDFETFDSIPQDEVNRLASFGYEQGALARAALHSSRIPSSYDAWFNISRVAVDATDPFDLSRGEVEGRRQALSAANYLTTSVPGCSDGRLVAFAGQLGIRESRRISGEYVISGDDIRSGRAFPDTIAWGAYPIDVHPTSGGDLKFTTLGRDHRYSIPYLSLVPRDLANVLIAGRGISATHEAHAAVRVMPIGMAIGQAAGTAAAILAKTGGVAREIDIGLLQGRLTEGRAYLE